MIEASADPSRQPISFEEIAKFPLPGTALPAQVAFSPNGRVLTYVYSPDSSLDRRLFALDLDATEATASGALEVRVGDGGVREEVLSRDEQLRRERPGDMLRQVEHPQVAEHAKRRRHPIGHLRIPMERRC